MEPSASRGMTGPMMSATVNGVVALLIGITCTGVPGFGWQIGAWLMAMAKMLITEVALIRAGFPNAWAIQCLIG